MGRLCESQSKVRRVVRGPCRSQQTVTVVMGEQNSPDVILKTRMIQDDSSLERDRKSRERSPHQEMNGSQDPLREEERKTRSSMKDTKQD